MTASSQLADKQVAACEAVQLIQSGMLVGLGSGSTSLLAVKALGKRIRKENIEVKCIPTSRETQSCAEQENIPLIDFSQTTNLDIAIDGADEISPQWDLIKGGGGYLLREKIVASMAKEVVIIGDSTKYKTCLGQFPVPLEVSKFGWQYVQAMIQKTYTPKVNLRLDHSQNPLITDNGNYILDCYFQEISQPAIIATELIQIPGVLEHGLFINMASKLVVVKDGQLINF